VGRWLIGVGLAIAAIGLVLQFAPGLLNWFGRLPGDIRIEHEHSKVFIPITSMILISVVLTIILNVLRR